MVTRMSITLESTKLYEYSLNLGLEVRELFFNAYSTAPYNGNCIDQITKINATRAYKKYLKGLGRGEEIINDVVKSYMGMPKTIPEYACPICGTNVQHAKYVKRLHEQELHYCSLDHFFKHTEPLSKKVVNIIGSQTTYT